MPIPLFRRSLAVLTCAGLLTLGIARAQGDALRADISTPLQAAQQALQAGKPRDALALLHEAEAVRDRTPYENYVIERLRGSAAAALGDDATATRSFEAVLASGRLEPAEQLQVLESLARSAYRAKNHPKAVVWAERYFQQGGTAAAMRRLQLNARYQGGDYAGVVRELQGPRDSVQPAGPTLDEPTLKLLAASQLKLNDEAAYAATLEKLVAAYPKKDYWADLLARVQSRPGFADRLALDMLRLQRATQTLDEPADYVTMAQLSLRAALPAEAKQVLDAGFAAGKLGTGTDAQAHIRLREQVAKQATEDAKTLSAAPGNRSADALVNTGQALVTTGRTAPGIELMEQGLAKGGLKQPDDARLHLGEAYWQAGDRDRAVAAFRAVKGSDGTADLARLWALVALRP